MEGLVKYIVDDKGIATLSFFHPQSNSLPASILQDLAEGVLQAGRDPQAKILILRSEGERAFCAGASFDELKAIGNEAEGKAFFSGFARVINALRSCGKIAIGRVQGKAVGGGLGLASAVDYCLATTHAAIRLSELAVGIGPFVVGLAVQRKLGLSAFSDLTLSPQQWKDADWAYQKGLYAEVYPDIDVLDKAIREKAGELVQYSEEALREIKKMLWQGTDHWETLLYERAAISGKLIINEKI